MKIDFLREIGYDRSRCASIGSIMNTDKEKFVYGKLCN